MIESEIVRMEEEERKIKIDEDVIEKMKFESEKMKVRLMIRMEEG